MLQPPAKVRAFLIKYQDRVLYGTDLVLSPDENTQSAINEWEDTYARDWKYFAGSEAVDSRGGKIRGLALPNPVLQKLFRKNALRWFRQ